MGSTGPIGDLLNRRVLVCVLLVVIIIAVVAVVVLTNSDNYSNKVPDRNKPLDVKASDLIPDTTTIGEAYGSSFGGSVASYYVAQPLQTTGSPIAGVRSYATQNFIHDVYMGSALLMQNDVTVQIYVFNNIEEAKSAYSGRSATISATALRATKLDCTESSYGGSYVSQGMHFRVPYGPTGTYIVECWLFQERNICIEIYSDTADLWNGTKKVTLSIWTKLNSARELTGTDKKNNNSNQASNGNINDDNQVSSWNIYGDNQTTPIYSHEYSVESDYYIHEGYHVVKRVYCIMHIDIYMHSSGVAKIVSSDGHQYTYSFTMENGITPRWDIRQDKEYPSWIATGLAGFGGGSYEGGKGVHIIINKIKGENAWEVHISPDYAPHNDTNLKGQAYYYTLAAPYGMDCICYLCDVDVNIIWS